MKKFICFLSILSILLNTFIYAEPITEVVTDVQSTVTNDIPILGAETAAVIDPETGILLYGKEQDKKMYPASITKTMTALLAIEYAENSEKGFDEIITHSHNAVYNIGPGSSHIGMRENEQISLDDALYGILLASANEVCMAVAEHIDGSVDKFVEHMNKRAVELGAINTHFANPHGFHDENHYTTAHDIALIMAEAVKHEDFIRYISTYEHQIPFTNVVQEIRYLHNSNKLISPYSNYHWEGCIGGKTGFTDQAGNTLVIYGGNGEKKFVASVMKENGKGNAYTDTKSLIEYAETLYSGEKTSILSEDTSVKELDIMQNGEKVGTASLFPTKDFKIELPIFMSKDDIAIDLSTATNFEVPIGIGKSAGTAYAILNNKVIFKTNLVVSKIIDKDGQPTDFINLTTADKSSSQNIFFNIIIIALIVVLLLLAILVALYIINNIHKKRKRQQRIKMREIQRRERRKALLEKKHNTDEK